MRNEMMNGMRDKDNLYVNNAIGIRNYPKIMLHNKNYNK